MEFQGRDVGEIQSRGPDCQSAEPYTVVSERLHTEVGEVARPGVAPFGYVLFNFYGGTTGADLSCADRVSDETSARSLSSGPSQPVCRFRQVRGDS